MSIEKKRIQWIDVAKGICMISIIAGHLGVSKIKNFVFAYHLTVYFILSGYTLKCDLTRQSLNKKFRTLMVPYFVICFCVMCMDVLNAVFLQDQTTVAEVTGIIGTDLVRSFFASGSFTNFASIETGSRIGALWFLPALFFAVLFAQLLIGYVGDRRVRYGIGVVLMIAAYITAPHIWLPFSIQSALFAVPFLLLGYDLKQYNVIDRLNIRHFLAGMAFLVIGYYGDFSMIIFVTASAEELALSSVCAVTSSLCVFYLAKKAQWCRPLGWIGRNGLYCLCVHLFEMETMGSWFRRLMNLLEIPNRTGWNFAIRFVFIIAVTGLILQIKKFAANRTAGIPAVPERDETGRDVPLDVAKAILIACMLVGHFKIDAGLRDIIYSFHMVAFVFYSGYCFNPSACRDLKRGTVRLVRQFLIPYGVFGILYTVLRGNDILASVKTVLAGISFTDQVFTDLASVGPVYFILLLFLTRLIYLFLERYLPDEFTKSIVVAGLSVAGMFLGKLGYWLPWSLDCALYALVFYHLGHCFKKYGIMEYLCQRGYSYFVLSCVWAYMVYSGAMELACRQYEEYGLVVLGAVSAAVLLYMLCRYLSAVLERHLRGLLGLVGRSTLYILIIHALFVGDINSMLAKTLSAGHVFHFAASVLVQLAAGTLMGFLFAWGKRKLRLRSGRGRAVGI